jgi:hypothetical protein
MKDILVDGHRILTSDEVADAVIDYALILAERGGADVVEFPSIHNGAQTRCALLLGGGAIAVVEAPRELAAVLGGAERASAEIVRRADALR